MHIVAIFGASCAASFAVIFSYALILIARDLTKLRETDAEHQRQIADLKRELEEMKKQAEPQSLDCESFSAI